MQNHGGGNQCLFCVDYVFRKAGFILFKWNYILQYFCNFHIGIFLLGKERKNLIKGI